MCGRLARTSTTQAIVREFGVEQGDLPEIAPSYNAAPSQLVAAIVDDGRRRLVRCRWGFIPHWAKDAATAHKSINARAGSVAEKPTFSAAFKRHRCLVAADGFYEWRRTPAANGPAANGPAAKTPVYIRLKSGKPFGFAGLYSMWTNEDGSMLLTCTIITTEANALVGKIHDRMAVIIHKGDYGLWLGPGVDKNALLGLLRPYPDDEMEAYDVSVMVNSPKNDSPECIKPLLNLNTVS
ncbi:MAG: SOS response-associated peptidase [Nitrospirae bacterium]|nr:SOS response-associated peptidase [Nitrospirota bacterium]